MTDQATVTAVPAPIVPAEPTEGKVIASIKYTKPESGHFTATLPFWGNAPQLMASDGAIKNGKGLVARLHEKLSATHSIYKIESWGEFLSTDVIQLREVTKDPFGAGLFHPDWDVSTLKNMSLFFSNLRIQAGTEILSLVSNRLEITPAGKAGYAEYKSDQFAVNVKLTQLFRSPIARLETVIQRAHYPNSRATVTITLDETLLTVDGERKIESELSTYLGTVSSLSSNITTLVSYNRTDPETLKAIRNAKIIWASMPLVWMALFLGTLPVSSTGQETHSLLPRDYPNAPGSDTSFGITCTSAIYTPFAKLEGILDICASADKFLAQPSHWLEPGTCKPVAVGPGLHPNLTMHKMHPWTNESQAKYMDGLGIFGQYESANPTPAGINNFDHEHRAIAPLAAAYVLTGRLDYQIALRSRAHTEMYERSIINGWVQTGRGAGRPLATMAVMAAADSYCYNLLGANASLRIRQVLDRQENRWPDITKPVIVATTFSEGGYEKFTGYEEGLLAQAALLCYLQWADPNALRLAWISGRTTTSTVRFVGNEWVAGYQVPCMTDGTACPDNLIVPPGPWLRRWSVAGMKAFVLANLEYTRLNLPKPSNDPALIQRAKDATVWFESFFPDTSPVETTTDIHQTMYKTITFPTE